MTFLAASAATSIVSGLITGVPGASSSVCKMAGTMATL
jgi:hypothetical protein